MEAVSDDEFYEARNEISSTSGSDGSQDEHAKDSGGRRRSRRRGLPIPSRDPQPSSSPLWSTESRFSVWQDGPKSIQERRRLLHERFGGLGRKTEVKGAESVPNAGFRELHDKSRVPGTRIGFIDRALSDGLIREAPLGPASLEAGLANGYGANTHGDHPREHSGSATDRRAASDHQNSTDSRNGGIQMLGRSRSEPVALVGDRKTETSKMNGLPQSADASTRQGLGMERLTQTSGAVLRERRWGSASWKPPPSNRVTVDSKLPPTNMRNLSIHFQSDVEGGQDSVSGRENVHSNTANVPSLGSSPTPAPAETEDAPVKVLNSNQISYEPLAFSDGSGFNLRSGHLAPNSMGVLVDALQNMVSATRTPSKTRTGAADEQLKDVSCKIRDLDSGKEFVVDELGTDGDPRLRDLHTGKELTLEEFENSLGLSPIMQEVRRRERELDSLDDNGAAIQSQDSTVSSKKKKSLWARTMKGVAKTVGGVSRTKSNLDSSRLQSEGSRDNSVGEEGVGSVGKGIRRREGSADVGKKFQQAKVKRSIDDQSESHRPWSPRPTKVTVYKKSVRDLSDLNMAQEIQAHQGAIWAMKFSLDGRYLASAGQDGVIHVREVVDHPFSSVHGAAEGVAESSGGKVDGDSGVNPEGSVPAEDSPVQVEEGYLKRRGSRRGLMVKRKSKSNSSSRTPKLFWLSESPICSFKGHTEDVLDLSWSRTEFLLSSSMDKTVRLWHISCGDCLRVFSHNDFVTCIEFSPTDDRYFLSGSLDAKVRIWSIPDHQVVDWTDVREMVTAARYAPDGKRAVIGTYKGTCRFYDTTGHKLQLSRQIEVRNAQSKKYRGKKITGLEFMPGDSNKMLVTSNDSRVRVYDGQELSLKFKGLRNLNSQISASFTRSGSYIVSASEDSRVYVWNSSVQEIRRFRKEKPQAYEHFPSSNVSIAVPWAGLDPQLVIPGAKEDQSELDTSSSRQSGNDEPSRSSLRGSQCSSSSSSSSESSQSESGIASESVGECQPEQSIPYLGRNGLAGDATEDEVTSKRSDTTRSSSGQGDKHGTLHGSFRNLSGRDYHIQGSAASPALSSSYDVPLVRQSSSSPGSNFFSEVTPKSNATWPLEKLPPLQVSLRSRGGSWSASSPSQDIQSTEVSPVGSTAEDATTLATWGLVIVTASIHGEIRTFQNYGNPVAL